MPENLKTKGNAARLTIIYEKIAIVNRTNLKNYGSVLQVYALCEVVKSLGYDVEAIFKRTFYLQR